MTSRDARVTVEELDRAKALAIPPPWTDVLGRVTAEMFTPYPPGIPAALPGERLNRDVLEYLHSGVRAGVVIPDAADPGLDSVRVAVEE
ncbi:hypothetical protein [Kitasatospora sp. NPDC091207]|uniref:Orn/Lys/Arg family decarboxylase n=1 Tax=Kitasatospora sp. NPDC091207 TaxID=3364083 RepID=UPI00381F4003